MIKVNIARQCRAIFTMVLPDAKHLEELLAKSTN